MDVMNGNSKKGLIIKTWERCRSIGAGGNGGKRRWKSKSWPRSSGAEEAEKRARKLRVAPEGCFSVYVGPQKQRFVVKTEYANHPLFQVLLEEAELEYGYNSEGPLALPCNVDIFYKVLVEMDDHYDDDDDDEIRRGWSRFAKGNGSYRVLSPSRLVSMNKF